MKLSIITAVALLSTGASTYAQNSVTLRFFDSATGKAIVPAKVELHSQASSREVIIEGSSFPSAGSTSCLLESGFWTTAVYSRGYEPQVSRIVSEDQSTIEFHLDPLTLPQELLPSRIQSLYRNDATLVVGYVVDDETGAVVDNVLVTTNEGETRTNHEGYFQSYIALTQPLFSQVAGQTIIFKKEGYNTDVRTNIEVWPNGDWIYRIRLRRGAETLRHDEGKQSHISGNSTEDCQGCDSPSPRSSPHFPSSVMLPSSIRVGRNCSGTSCSTVQVFSLQTYVKYVLPAEWYSCWGSLANGNGQNSLAAGAVGIRSYGLWYVYNPLRDNYDICDNTSCQVVGSAQSSNANAAVDATARYILTNGTSTQVQRSEYSAENNNSGCGDGFTGTGSSYPCIEDRPCQTQTRNGHGRGMCQWGTARWASGTIVTTGSPCSMGIPHSGGSLTWQQILAHYYPTYTLTQGASASIDSARPIPAVVQQGGSFTINYSITTSEGMSVILDAGIAPTGTGVLSLDRAHDAKVGLFEGQNTASRIFSVTQLQTLGVHDLYVALWHDKNNNNVIDGGDFIINAQLVPGALTVTRATGVDESSPCAFALFQNYPNPFNPSTEIKFSVETRGQATLDVYNALGQKVATLFNDVAQSGQYYRVRFDASTLSSGVYFYRFQSGRKVQTRALTILK